jgi:hypothetical protein
MSEFLMWVLGGFWRFVGFLIILGYLFGWTVGLAKVVKGDKEETDD